MRLGAEPVAGAPRASFDFLFVCLRSLERRGLSMCSRNRLGAFLEGLGQLKETPPMPGLIPGTPGRNAGFRFLMYVSLCNM
jgi:hypothetical protein